MTVNEISNLACYFDRTQYKHVIPSMPISVLLKKVLFSYISTFFILKMHIYIFQTTESRGVSSSSDLGIILLLASSPSVYTHVFTTWQHSYDCFWAQKYFSYSDNDNPNLLLSVPYMFYESPQRWLKTISVSK